MIGLVTSRFGDLLLLLDFNGSDQLALEEKFVRMVVVQENIKPLQRPVSIGGNAI